MKKFVPATEVDEVEGNSDIVVGKYLASKARRDCKISME
jgi:hypothetical protein